MLLFSPALCLQIFYTSSNTACNFHLYLVRERDMLQLTTELGNEQKERDVGPW